MTSAGPPVAAGPEAVPMAGADSWPSPQETGAAPKFSSRDVMLRRALVISLVVFVLLLVAIMWLLLRRKGVI